MNAFQFLLLRYAVTFISVLRITLSLAAPEDDCPLLLSLPLLPSHNNYSDNIGYEYDDNVERDRMHSELAKARYAELYMSYLAIQHINSKNGTFVSELYDLSCDFNIPYVVTSNHVDATYEFLTTSSPLQSNTHQQEKETDESDTTIIITSDSNYKVIHDEVSSLCAVVGPIDSEGSQGSNVANYIAGQPDLVQISPLSFDVDPINNPQLLESFFRSSVTAEELSMNLAKYLTWKERKYVAVLYDSSSQFSSTISQCLQNNIPTSLITTIDVPYVGENVSSVATALSDIQTSGFSTIVWVESQITDIFSVAIVAQQTNLSTSEYLWIVIPHDLMTERAHWSLSMVQGSPLELFSRRVLLYKYNGVHETNSSNVIKLNSFDDDSIHQRTQVTLRKISPSIMKPKFNRENLNITADFTSAAYLYDSIVSIALGHCAAKNLHDNSRYNGIRRVSFDGVTGQVRFNTLTNERGKEPIAMILQQPLHSVTNAISLYIDISVYYDQAWYDRINSLAYVLPDPSRIVKITNHVMSKTMQCFLVTTSFIISIAATYFLLFISQNRNLTDIEVAQPMYLSLHCLCSIILNLSQFIFVGIRGGYLKDDFFCYFTPIIRVIGIPSLVYICFIKVCLYTFFLNCMLLLYYLLVLLIITILTYNFRF